MKNRINNTSHNNNNDNNNNNNDASISPISTAIQNAIVAGVSNAQSDNNITESSNDSKRTIKDANSSAGSVGSEFIKRREKE